MNDKGFGGFWYNKYISQFMGSVVILTCFVDKTVITEVWQRHWKCLQ